MGFIKDTFFGGAEKKAAKASQKGIEAGQDFIRQGTQEARQDIQNIFPGAQQSLQQGFQGAADIFGASVPQQANVFQQGNLAAQQQIAAGLPQFQNAILGNQVDFSQFQPTQLQQPDFSFLQTQLPQAQNPFAQPEPFMGPQQTQPPQQGFSTAGFGGLGNQSRHPFMLR